MFEEPSSEQPSRDEDATSPIYLTPAQVVAGWRVPPGAHRADTIKRGVLAALAAGTGDMNPVEAVAHIAIGPVVAALGRLEADLADARSRIAELEQALRDRDGQ
ncbi:hypothetical protein [Nocardia coubleae]|uniref:hypothetical protein n=1 Tax=Nocardia TaxID=1817 RepID=UPI000ACC6981|nr:hypothetical protein [Nocardia coubleae]